MDTPTKDERHNTKIDVENRTMAGICIWPYKNRGVLTTKLTLTYGWTVLLRLTIRDVGLSDASNLHAWFGNPNVP